MSLTGVEEDYLTLLDWRRRVSTLYAGVRGALDPRDKPEDDNGNHLLGARH